MTKEDRHTITFIPERYRPENRARISSVDDVLWLEQKYPFINMLEEFEKRALQPFESVHFAQKEHFILARLDELVRIMRVNPVWREKLDGAGVTEVKDWSNWHQVPITTRDDLNALYTRTKDGLVIPWEYASDHDGHKMIASGGSNNEPVITVYRTQELRDIGERAGKFWKRHIVGKNGQKVTFLNLFSNQNGWASNELVQNILERIPGANTIPAGVITLPRVINFFLKQGATDLAGLPSDFSHLVRLIEEEYPGASYPDVKLATYGGEFMDPVIKDQLQRVFPNITLVSVYSSTQASHMAVQVGDDADLLSVTDDINLLEIVDEDGQPVSDGQTGRIVVTRLLGNGDQALRLDLQDKGSILAPDPGDPLQARKLRLYGRAGDYLRVSTWDINAKDLLSTSYDILREAIPVEGIQARQFVVDELGVHLKLAVADPTQCPKLDPQAQFRLMHTAIMSTKGFFEDPHDFPPSIQLTIDFVRMGDLEQTSAGKIHPFVNRRGEDTK